MIDMAKTRREDMRWHLLSAVNLSRPAGIYTEPLVAIVRAVYPDATHQECWCRCNLDQLNRKVPIQY